MLKAHVLDHFENLLDYYQWINNTFDTMSEMNKQHLYQFTKESVEREIRYSPEWYGEGASYEVMSKGITEYIRPDLIEKIYNQVSAKVSNLTKNKIKRKKIHYNPNGLGVFLFDRAAMGMYRLKEFFSPSLNKVVEREEVQRLKGEYRLIKDNSLVVERWEEKEGKPKIRTSSKNVYTFYEKVNKEKQAVDLLVSCGGHVGIIGEQFLYSGMSALIVAQLLEQAGIPNRISIVIGSSPDKYSHTAYACLIPVKNYDERLDINLLALLSSDPRFFRYEGFRGIIALYEHFKRVAPSSLGAGMNRDRLKMVMEQSTYTKTSRLAPNRFYFGWTFTEAAAIEAINEAIEEIAQRQPE